MKTLLIALMLSMLLGIQTIPNPPAGDGRIVRGFDLPIHQYAAGHRGVDLAANFDDLVVSPISGRVHFSGFVVNRSVITIATAHILLSMEPVDSFLAAGDFVKRGQIVGFVSSGGHCDSHCIHIGVRRAKDKQYINPIPYLLQLPRLLPTKP